MAPNDASRQPIQVTTIGDRLWVRVPWEQAEHCLSRLEAQGIVSTLHLDPIPRESHLEIWSAIDPGRVQAVLQGLGA